MSTTRPYFPFYPGDWLRDTALRSCSLEARGLWIDMLCYMHDGEPYGHLKVKGKVISEDNLSGLLGVNLRDLRRLLKELERAGVFDRGSGDVILNRRMVRDDELRQRRASGGAQGGNPALLKRKRGKGTHVNLEDNLSEPPRLTTSQPSSGGEGYPAPANAAAYVVSSSSERGVQGGETRPPPLDYATRCCLAVNRVLEQQLAGAYTTLVANVERPTARAWEAAGIPIDLAEATLTELSGRFPNGRGRQPQSLGYFTAALHEAHAKARGHAAGAAFVSPGDRARARADELEREGVK